MPFKSEKQRKWMYANDPEMAKKWEKEESIKGKLRNLIKQEIKSINEDNIKFSKEEMAQLHKDGKVEKGDHTIEFNESTKEYGKTLDKIAKDRQLKSISKKDRDQLNLILNESKLLKSSDQVLAALREVTGHSEAHLVTDMGLALKGGSLWDGLMKFIGGPKWVENENQLESDFNNPDSDFYHSSAYGEAKAGNMMNLLGFGKTGLQNVPLIGWIAWLIWMCTEGSKAKNRFGTR